jgi:hypothetical protein
MVVRGVRLVIGSCFGVIGVISAFPVILSGRTVFEAGVTQPAHFFLKIADWIVNAGRESWECEKRRRRK